MERAEKYGLGVAAAGHVLLFGLLSVGFLATPNPLKLESKPIDISLVDEVALESAAPAATEAPAPSEAPEVGPPDDSAPAPVEAPPEPQPAPPPPAPTPPKPAPPKPAPPKPAPAPVARPAPAKPQPPKPAAAKPAPAAPAKPVPKPARPGLSRPDVAPERSGANPSAKAARPRGSLLGDDFKKSLAIASEKGAGQAPRAAAVSATAVAGLGDAIARQVQPCANRINNPGPGANLIRTKLRIRMNPDGSLAARPVVSGQTGTNDENQRYAQRVGELAGAAVIQCAPYKLPAELYEGGWKDIIINYRLPG
ncbi:MAG: cell envelope biogenesis protein TolA [Pseudomonadota bacterium]